MAITRTIIVDDDGSGKTGTVIDNAWKQELYNQIDALAGGANTLTAWTPHDGSGAGLVINNFGCGYVVIGKLVFILANVSYPGNSSPNQAWLGGLPFANHGAFTSGFYQTYGLTQSLHLPWSENRVKILNPTSYAQRINSELSGVSVVFAGFYSLP